MGAAQSLLTGRAAIIVDDTARLFSAKHLLDHARCAADPRSHIQGTTRAVAPAGAALDARITQRDLNLPEGKPEDLARTDGKTHSAACATLRVEGEGDYIVKVEQGAHTLSTLP
jgi:hypothetical protein